MLLSYHQPTIDLIAQSPILRIKNWPSISPDNVVLLEEKEKQYNIRFPASIREWFSLNLPLDVLPVETGVPEIRDLQPLLEMEEIEHPQTEQNLWYFLHSEYVNQGGDYLFFQADGGDDPPVYAKYGNRLIEIAEKFSVFLYNHFWDYHKHNLLPYRVSLINHPAIQSLQLPIRYFVPFQKLRLRYKERSDNLCTRFYDDHVCIWVYKLSDKNGEPTFNHEIIEQAFIQADSIENLEDMINYLWEDDQPVHHLSSPGNKETRLIHVLQQKNEKKGYHGKNQSG